jgi:hypothetical protein
LIKDIAAFAYVPGRRLFVSVEKVNALLEVGPESIVWAPNMTSEVRFRHAERQ